MNREFKFNPPKTYATKKNARKAIANTGHDVIRHTIIQNEEGRWFPVVFPTAEELSTHAPHFHWITVRM